MPSKRDDIRRLLKLSENREKTIESTDIMLDKLRKSCDGLEVPQALWDDLRNELLRFDEMEDDLVEIYDKRLSHEDVLWAIAAHESPEGKAFFGALADISQDSLKVAMERGNRVTKKVMAKHGMLPD
jgi:hypothetical protein